MKHSKKSNIYISNREVILRDRQPEDIIRLIAEKLGINDIAGMMRRWKRNTMEFRQVVAYTLNVFCGMNIREVCKYMHNITGSCCRKLVDSGFELVQNKVEIKSILLGY